MWFGLKLFPHILSVEFKKYKNSTLRMGGRRRRRRRRQGEEIREIKGRRGITDFKLVCDSTNNTAAVIDRNEFIANVFVNPARSINFVTLNFVAVRTGVDFTEIVGTV